MVQWGKVGSGIEHGVKFDPTYAGEIHGFQLWVNLPAGTSPVLGSPIQYHEAFLCSIMMSSCPGMPRAPVQH